MANCQNAAFSGGVVTTQVGLAASLAGLRWSYRKLVLGLGELAELQGSSPKWVTSLFVLKTF